MSNYSVEWVNDAEETLADAWLNSSDPAAVTAAQALADRLLARDPLGNGTEVSEGLRRIIVPPLVLW